MARHSRIAGWLARIAPRRLGARFAWTVLVTNLAAVTVAVALMLVSVSFIASRTMALWAVGAGALASLAGLGVGLAVARAVVRPVANLTDLMAQRAADTITGRPGSPVEHDPSLPSELTDLIDVFNAAFDDLGRHQSALARAKEDAVAAKAALDVAFVDSLDGKALVTDGVVALINPAACSHLGIGADEALGVPPEEFLGAGDFLDGSEEPVDPRHLLEESQRASVTVQRRPAGLSTRWIEVHAIPHEQDPSTLLISTRDVTEERRVDELRNEIMGLVTHDLRAPLTVITGYLELLGRDLDERSRSNAIESARHSATLMSDLLEDLLAATRAEEMFTPVELARVSLRDIAEETVVSFEHTSSHPLRLQASCPGEVLGEERRLRQVLVNLVTNALKYSPEDSPVDVSVTCSDGAVTLVVEDRGDGVKESERELVFERFTRLPDQVGGRKPGVGLGLYIVKAIVESHGGSVAVTNRLDGERGARFVVKLPHAPAVAG